MSIISTALAAFRTNRRTALLLAAATFAIPLSAARAEYPDHPITIIACFPPGGGTDIAVRLSIRNWATRSASP